MILPMSETQAAPARSSISLAHAPAVDVHCHGWRTDDLLAQPREGFFDRVTMLGMCLISSGMEADDENLDLASLTASTPMAQALRRRLAEHLGTSEDAEAVAGRRYELLHEDSEDYYGRLWADAQIEGLVVDDGYPLPRVAPEELASQSGLPVHHVKRLEPVTDAAREEAGSFAELEDAVVAGLEAAIGQGAVAFKSVIAYRTGLDVRAWAPDETEAAFGRWRAAGFVETREDAKPVRDALLRRTLEVAGRHGRPVHVHCGGGDPAIVLAHARPRDLFPTLLKHRDQPVVLIHSGWPWTEEAAYVASVLPQVYLDISVTAPWASLAIDQKLEVLLGAAPTAKVLYGSDEASEPEVLWFTAHMVRGALERVLSKAVVAGWATEDEAVAIGEGVMAGNTRRLHALS